MATKVIVNKRYSFNLPDFLKGAILAVGTPVIYILQEMIPNYPLDPIAKAAISAFLSYLLKNFFSPASVKTNYKSNSKAVQVAKTIK